MSAREFLLVWNGPIAGQEQEYGRWYDEVHLPDLLRIPGCMAAQRFRRLDAAYPPDADKAFHQFFCLYELSDRHAVMREIPVRRGTAAMPMTDALDRTSSQATYAELLDGEFGQIHDRLIVARISHAPGQREALQAWWQTRHAPEIVERVPAARAVLLTLTIEQLRPHQPFSYFALYALPAEAADAAAELAAIVSQQLVSQAGSLVESGCRIDPYLAITRHHVASGVNDGNADG